MTCPSYVLTINWRLQCHSMKLIWVSVGRCPELQWQGWFVSDVFHVNSIERIKKCKWQKGVMAFTRSKWCNVKEVATVAGVSHSIVKSVWAMEENLKDTTSARKLWLNNRTHRQDRWRVLRTVSTSRFATRQQLLQTRPQGSREVSVLDFYAHSHRLNSRRG